jgi:hypothetical protein
MTTSLAKAEQASSRPTQVATILLFEIMGQLRWFD